MPPKVFQSSDTTGSKFARLVKAISSFKTRIGIQRFGFRQSCPRIHTRTNGPTFKETNETARCTNLTKCNDLGLENLSSLFSFGCNEELLLN